MTRGLHFEVELGKLKPETFSSIKEIPVTTATKTATALLALDPSFRSTGWAVLKAGDILACGCIRTEPSTSKTSVRVADDDAECCQRIARQLADLIRKYAIGGIIAELPTGGSKNSRANGCMARAGAIVAVVAEMLKIPAEWTTPGAGKEITGKKVASKKEVEKAVLCRWPDAPLPKTKCGREHVADALAAYVAAENGVLVRVSNGTAQDALCE